MAKVVMVMFMKNGLSGCSLVSSYYFISGFALSILAVEEYIDLKYCDKKQQNLFQSLKKKKNPHR